MSFLHKHSTLLPAIKFNDPKISETFAGVEGGNVLERPHVPHPPLSPETLTHFITVNRKESHAPLPLRASSISWGAQVMIDGAWCEAI